jgi:hypothetical protein
MSKIVPELVRGFDFTLALAPGEALELENLWFVKQNNLFVTVAVREGMDKD